MTSDVVFDECYEDLSRAMGLQLPWCRLIERVREMVQEQDKDTMSRHRIEELEAQLVRLLEDRASERTDPMDSVEARAMKDHLWSIIMRGTDGPVTWDMVALEAEKMSRQNFHLKEEVSKAKQADEAALAKAREEGERKGWEDCMVTFGMAIAADHCVLDNLREAFRAAEAAVKEAEMKVASGEAYYDLLKFRAPEGVKIGYEDSDSSLKKEGK